MVLLDSVNSPHTYQDLELSGLRNMVCRVREHGSLERNSDNFIVYYCEDLHGIINCRFMFMS